MKFEKKNIIIQLKEAVWLLILFRPNTSKPLARKEFKHPTQFNKSNRKFKLTNS